MKPIVAIVGRPNVGKSTFFNRITKTRDALVDDMPGVTRDRNYGDAVWNDVAFTLVDTGGYFESDEDAFAGHIRFQVDQAIDDADMIVLMLDGKSGVSPFDVDIVELLRSVTIPVFYAVNKIDGPEKEALLYDFYGLGLDAIFPVSSEHGYGVGDLLDEIVSRLPAEEGGDETDVVKVAVVGRPNAGKSSLINRILGEKRLVVSETPGTTRDAIDSVCRVNDTDYLLIDTAGIRRKGRVSQKLEKFSVIKALKSLDRCDIAIILIDASEGITEQDIKVAGYADERKCGCIFLLNKWDLIDKNEKTVKHFYEKLGMEAKFLSFAPAMTISALTGLRVNRIFKLVDDVYAQYTSRIGTGTLNKIIDEATRRTEPSLHHGRRLKFLYATQIAIKPPTFVLFVNYPEAVHFSYQRYLVNQIRQATRLDHTPIRLIFRKRTQKFHFEKKRTGTDRSKVRSKRKNKKDAQRNRGKK